ncbi:MAG: hypothetical protein LBH43_12955 [Treponema sp.]|jgi:hypothetical protein|nr:hypothetical protein [Treponema sp.]
MTKTGAKIRHAEKGFLRGRLYYTVYKNGVEIETFADSNLIVNTARLQMSHLVAGDVSGRSINRVALGTNGSVAIVTDTEIANAFVKNVDSFEYPAIDRVKINWKILQGEANGMAIMEFGLLTEDGKLFARRRRDKPLNKESDISIEGEWIIIF